MCPSDKQKNLLPAPLITALALISEEPFVEAQTIDALSVEAGAYLVIMEIAEAFDLTISTLPATRLVPGYYVYCGSAKGPGGIKARLKRHFSSNKRQHWHIDHLTLRAERLWALAVPGGEECALLQELSHTGKFILPVKGFGASDCSSCQSHLLSWK